MNERTRTTRILRTAAATALLACVVIAAAYLLPAAFSGGGDDSLTPSTTSIADATATDDTFSEARGPADPATIENAAFVSIILQEPEGLHAYSLTADTAEFRRLAELVTETEPQPAEGISADGTIVFVGHDNSTITFEVDRDNGILERNEQAWLLGSDVTEILAALEERS